MIWAEKLPTVSGSSFKETLQPRNVLVLTLYNLKPEMAYIYFTLLHQLVAKVGAKVQNYHFLVHIIKNNSWFINNGHIVHHFLFLDHVL